MKRKSLTIGCLAATAISVSIAANAEPKKIVLLNGIAGDPMYITMTCGAQDVAKKHGYAFDAQGPQKWDAAMQRPILDSIIASKPAGIIVVPTDDTALTRAMKQAKQDGIKIVLADTSTKDMSFASSFVTSDDAAIGRAAFDTLKKLAPQGGAILSLGAAPGVSTSDGRVAAFRKSVAADPKYKDVGVQYAQTDTTRANQVVSSALQRNPNLVGIFSVDALTADGAAAAVRQAGQAGKVQIISVDASPNQVSAVREGTQQGLIAQEPYVIGSQAAEQLIAAIEGKPTKARVDTGTVTITKANADTAEGKSGEYLSACK
ncbi:substrate-binding domain-containing protein [Paraburkholderia sp. Ac-20340]|uniref:substrate-binding domain-containing protein n=1 Tax=Paraburkholderia sp. Ac-20340 TaxID=2703888 RepID=UPI00197E02F1|nr:substrate-binding domain-containing protein [Paraburkholderia sp. Ac-20340]MBN3853973.1 substrate-binding domain-containing protein [Paraburkholderia sp. Ac-20340]